jgi:hypothetical protein
MDRFSPWAAQTGGDRRCRRVGYSRLMGRPANALMSAQGRGCVKSRLSSTNVQRPFKPRHATATKTPTAWSASTSQEEPTSRASPRPISTRLPCDSINVRERPWASKPQPINYERCCTDRLNSHLESGHPPALGQRRLGAQMQTSGTLAGLLYGHAPVLSLFTTQARHSCLIRSPRRRVTGSMAGW